MASYLPISLPGRRIAARLPAAGLRPAPAAAPVRAMSSVRLELPAVPGRSVRPAAGRRVRLPHRPRPATAIFLLLAAVAAGAGAFANFYRLSRAPIQLDEALYANMGWRYVHWSSLPTARRTPELTNFEHPPLAKVLFGVAEALRGGPDLDAARAVSAACTLGTALILGLWLGAAVNRWAGLLAGSMLALIPMSVAPQVTRFGRAAMLDPVAGLFVVGSLALGWYWFQRSGRQAWVLAIAAGVSAGLASACKENGFLGLVVPVVVGVAWSSRPMSALLVRLAQAVTAALAAMATFLCCYLPFGDPLGRIGYLYRFQSRHSRNGHLMGFDGRLSIHPPWWANLWFAGQGVGPVLSWALPLTGLAAVVLRRDRLTAWLAASLVAPLIFHCWLAGVVLPFYWTLWMPAVLALSALGCWELLRRAARPERWVRAGSLLAAVCALAAVAVPSAGQLDRMAKLQWDGPAALPGTRDRLGLHGGVLVTGFLRVEAAVFSGSAPVYVRWPKDPRGIDTVLVGRPRCRTSLDPTIRAVVATNLRSGSLRLVRADRLGRLYVATGPLRAPEPADVRAQPAIRMITGC